ncbi:DNA-binding transcriptional MerR regulator [Saccharothrix tamanrassetensis]|uniref:DNA-binding transcriptional MerR regulator n=1 Tax=Saccharothrix tamanrassetensis TaxID=1051531 RepID=A0A841CS41_9PSEU|nr:MerR family transcriptional regulator [Saccharothrix tamanrassetensis]MBB5960119.1 DNA-binding transcriptional MerR regulator [Saccharothrix tamanrassetensis]
MTGTEHLKQPRWSVGALAKVTGLTVRTLHHYDELGLLRPSERTHSGHRRYTEPDLRRLYQIRLLRRLGMSLEEIGEVLADPSHGPLREVLSGHLEQLDDQMWRLEALRRQTRGLLDQLDGPPQQDSGSLLSLLGCTGIFDEYLSEEQREFLDRQAEGLGEVGRKELDAEWPQVLAGIIAHYRADTPVDDREVQELGRRLAGVGRDFAGGDPAILRSMSTFFREHGHGVLRDVLPDQPLADLGDGLWDYVSRVHSAAR